MKAITLYQPWASLIAAGIKRYETRHWPPRSGQLTEGEELAIHAGMRIVKPLPPYLEELIANLPETLPLPTGAVLCVCRFEGTAFTYDVRDQVGDTERACGDWSFGRFAWELTVLRVFPHGIPTRGHQGIWNWDEMRETRL